MQPKYVVEEINQALVRNIGRPRTVLDVGCGCGLNGEVARSKGAHVVGIDLDSLSLERARSRLDEVLRGSIETDEILRVLEGRKFDLLILGDVLEHVLQPAEALHRVSSLLEDGGHALISLPNIAAWTVRLGLLAGRFDYEPSGILDDSHLRFFTRATAVHMVQAAGLEVLRLDLNPMIVRAGRAVVRRRWLASQTGDVDPTALMHEPLYKAYQRWVRPAETVFASLAPGLLAFQNVILARKPPRAGPLSLTVGMLTLNEVESVGTMIDEIRGAAPDAQILVVDSSSDATPDIAASRGARVVRQIPARGHGPAMQRLMYEAAGQSEALIYLDCDFTYPPAVIPRIRKLLEEGADVVNASRTHVRPQAMPMTHFLANRLFASTARVVHGVTTTDVHSGMRGYRSSVIRAFDFDGEGDALPLDTLILPARCGYHVVELPIAYQHRVGESKLRKVSGTVWTFVRIAGAVGKGRRVVRGGRFRHVAH